MADRQGYAPPVHRSPEQTRHTTDQGESITRDPVAGQPGGTLRLSVVYENADYVPDVSDPDAATRPSLEVVAVALADDPADDPAGEPLPVLGRGGGASWGPDGFTDRMWVEYDASSSTTRTLALRFRTRLGSEWEERVLLGQG